MNAASPTPRRLLGRGVLILAICLAVYAPALRGGYILDDKDYVPGNQPLRSLGGLAQIWLDPHATLQYYPLTHTTLWMEYRFWGLSSLGYHLDNVLLHAANALLVWVLLARLGVPGAFLAALLFVLHPVQVESVAWIAERKNLLSALFYLSSALAYARFAGLDASANGAPPEWRVRRRSYVLALALFAAALLAKGPAVITAPFAWALVVWWKRGRLVRRDLIPLAPFLAMGLALGAGIWYLEVFQVGTRGASFAVPFPARLIVAGRALWFYAGKLVWPASLSFTYPRWRIDPAEWRQWLFPVAAAAAALMLWAGRRRLGRAPFTAAAFHAITVAPLLGLIPFYLLRHTFVTDHFQYLPSIGPLALAAAGWNRLSGARAWTSGGLLRRAITVAMPLAVLVLLGLASARHAAVFRDAESIFRDTLAKNPEALMARVDLGNILFERGDLRAAEEQFRAALSLDPDRADAHYNLANVLARTGRDDEAEIHYREALRRRPGFAEAASNLGLLLARRGSWRESLGWYWAATRFAPRDAEVWSDFGIILLETGDAREAREALTRALEIDPGNRKARLALRMARETPGPP